MNDNEGEGEANANPTPQERGRIVVYKTPKRRHINHSRHWHLFLFIFVIFLCFVSTLYNPSNTASSNTIPGYYILPSTHPFLSVPLNTLPLSPSTTTNPQQAPSHQRHP